MQRHRSKVRRWFEASGLKVVELAERVGYAPSTVCHVVNGDNHRRRFTPRCKGKIIATLIWHCRKIGRDPRKMEPIAVIHCRCGRVHRVYAVPPDGNRSIEVLSHS